MRKFKKMLYGVCALFVASIIMTTPLSAGSLSEFKINWSDPFGVSGGGAAGSVGGPYIAIQGSLYGSNLEGNGQNKDGAKVNDATLGQTYGSVGVALGWTIPVSDTFLLGIDLSYQPGDGKITVDTGADARDTTGEDVTLTAGDTKTVSLMPMFAVSDTSAIYFKVGRTHLDLSWNDEMVTGLNSSMTGDTLAVGSRTIVGAHGFIQTEFGFSDFDTLNIHTVTSSAIGTADPESAYGAFTIGIKY